MAQTIRIKRSTGSLAPTSLAQGELAYSHGSMTFYVGDPGTVDTPIPIGGAIINNAGTPTLATGVTGAEVRSLIGAGTGSGTLTGITAGSLIDVSGSTNITVNVDLSELVDMTAGVNGSQDELVLLDNGVQRRKQISEITLSDFNNDAGWTSNTGTVTDQPAIVNTAGTPSFDTGITAAEIRDLIGLGTADNVEFEDVIVDGNLTVNGTTTTVNSETLTVDDNIIVLNNNAAGTPTENAGIEVERGTSDNVSLRWNETTDTWQVTVDGTNYSDLLTSATVGGVTSVSGGTGVDVSSSTGAVTFTIDLSELTDMTQTMVGSDEFIVLDNGADRRKAASEIGLSVFNNDSGFVTSSGVTSVSAGALIDVTGTTTPSIAVDLSELTDMTAAVNGGQDEMVLLDNGAQRRKLLSEIALSAFNNDAGWTSNVGDITSVQVSSTDGSITGTGTGSTGAIAFDLEVGTVDGGTY